MTNAKNSTAAPVKGKSPTHNLFIIDEYIDKATGEVVKHWINTGAAWVNENGTISIRLRTGGTEALLPANYERPD